MSASAASTEQKMKRRRHVAGARFPLWFAASEGARAALGVDSSA